MDQILQSLYEWLATEADERFGRRGLVLATLALLAAAGVALWWIVG